MDGAFPKWLCRLFLGLSASFAIAFVILLVFGKTAGAPHLLTGCFVGLALAAFTVLPLLEQSGFIPGQSNSREALSTLTFAYVALPCALKLIAFGFVLTLPTEK